MDENTCKTTRGAGQPYPEVMFVQRNILKKNVLLQLCFSVMGCKYKINKENS